MTQIIFVPHLPLETSLHLSCSDDMRVPNTLLQYKHLLFTDTEVAYFKLTPSYMEQRANIFKQLQGQNALVREFVDTKNYTYVLEVVVAQSSHLENYLVQNGIQFTR